MILISLSLLLSAATANNQQGFGEIVPAKQVVVKEVIKVMPSENSSITVHSSNSASLNFYLFDVEGKLVYQSIIKKNEKQLIEGLPKGTYLYNAFKNDENLEGGKITLK